MAKSLRKPVMAKNQKNCQQDDQLGKSLLHTEGSQFVLVCSFILEHFVLEQAWACGTQGVRQGANPLQPPRPVLPAVWNSLRSNKPHGRTNFRNC